LLGIKKPSHSTAGAFCFVGLLFTECAVFVAVQGDALLLGGAAFCAGFARFGFGFGGFTLFHGLTFAS
jgi:hypothetical protein